MADLRCKICGKRLKLVDDKPIVHHKCGADIAIPSKLTDVRIEKFNLAYKALRLLDFKKAQENFDSIIYSRGKTDYEANWGLALCEFKIEHALNPATKTIEIFSHYKGDGVFTKSQYYKTAVSYAPSSVKTLYRKLGKDIDEVLLNKQVIDAKLDDAFKLIHKEEFIEAEKTLSEISNTFTHHPMLYIGKLLCELNFNNIKKLSDFELPLTNFKNYNTAIHLADKETKIYLNTFNVAISERLVDLDFEDENSVIHTLDEMEITAEDSFDYTTADAALSSVFFLRDQFFRFLLFIKKHKLLFILLPIIVILIVGGIFISKSASGTPDYYYEGVEILNSGNIVEAAETLALGRTDERTLELLNSDTFIDEISSLYNEGKIREAMKLARLCSINSTGIVALDELLNNTVSGNVYHSLAVMPDGSVSSSYSSKGNTYGECEVSYWSDIISVSAGNYHSVGLKADGTVVAIGDNRFGQCNTREWTDIVAISAGSRHTVGLKADGTVVATEYLGENPDGQCNVSGWNNIVSVSAGDRYTVGLKSDGTLISTMQFDGIDKWTSVISISAGSKNLLALTLDGNVLTTANDDLSLWTNVISISAGNNYFMALKSDKTVLSTRSDFNDEKWSDIVSIFAGFDYAISKNSNGKFRSEGYMDIKNWNK